ncbi:MAG: cytidine deaminase [Flavobacteriales bacterium]
MIEKKINITYHEYNSLEELNQNDIDLVLVAEKNLVNSYSPYSLFKVSSLVRFKTGETVLGTNQENAAYPSGLCAERVAIFSAKSTYPNKNIDTIVIVTEQGNPTPFSPCGGCRQVLMEYEMAQKKPIRAILKSGNSKVWIFESISAFLPFAFNADHILKKE